jgi:hypothetical protein
MIAPPINHCVAMNRRLRVESDHPGRVRRRSADPRTAEIALRGSAIPQWATSGLMQCSKIAKFGGTMTSGDAVTRESLSGSARA